MAEMALAGNIGFVSQIAPNLPPLAGLYFGEDQGRYVVTGADFAAIKTRADTAGIIAVPVGLTGGSDCTFRWVDDGKEQKVSLAALREANEAFFRDWMEV
jgi:phosphoribosylformylglycinamidine synthase